MLFILTFKSVHADSIKKELLYIIQNFDGLSFQLLNYNCKKKITVLRAPFVHNKSREQFEQKTYKCKLIFNLKDQNSWAKYSFINVLKQIANSSKTLNNVTTIVKKKKFNIIV